MHAYLVPLIQYLLNLKTIYLRPGFWQWWYIVFPLQSHFRGLQYPDFFFQKVTIKDVTFRRQSVFWTLEDCGIMQIFFGESFGFMSSCNLSNFPYCCGCPFTIYFYPFVLWQETFSLYRFPPDFPLFVRIC